MLKIKKFFLDYFFVFFLIWINTGFISLSLPGYINISLQLILLLIIFITKKVKLQKNTLFLFFIIISFITISTFVNSDKNFFQYSLLALSLFVSLFFVSIISYNDFLIILSRIIYFLCIISIIIYFLYYIIPAIFNIFPLFVNKSGTIARNVLSIPIVLNSDPVKRNYGIFWEPGVFQFFINFAFLIDGFYSKKLSMKRFLVYSVAIFTTVSTTGIIAYILICLYYYIKIKKGSIKKVLIGFSVFMLLLFTIYLLPDIFFSRLLSKLNPFINFNIESLAKDTPVRIKAIVYPMKLFLSNPFFGVGINKLLLDMEANAYVMTCSILGFFVKFGFIYGMLMWYCVKRFFNLFNLSRVQGFILFTIFILITFTEDFSNNPILFLIIFYGFSAKYRIRGIVNEKK